ncbi:MAG: hypothetical protein Q4G60_06075 [bacterium]|nr:hypothetical protein [bacterium]
MEGSRLSYFNNIIIAIMLVVLFLCSVPYRYAHIGCDSAPVSSYLSSVNKPAHDIGLFRFASDKGISLFEITETEKLVGSYRRSSVHSINLCIYITVLAQLYFITIHIVQLFFKSEYTKRFSMIYYLHRSDGKKSHL